MELKPNFQLLEFLSHQNYFTNNYNMKAAELSAETGKSVIRYADDPVINEGYQNSIHTHINQVALDFIKIYHIANGLNYSTIEPALNIADSIYVNAPTTAFFHDDGEKPFKEWQTAYGETDPKIKEALKNFPIAAMEIKTGLIDSRVSLLAAHENNPRIYTDFIEECRAALDVKNNYSDGSPSAEKILLFNQTAMKILDKKEITLSKHSKWNNAELLRQYDFARTRYLEIETFQTADGGLVKVGEKVEGTTYQNRINHIKKNAGGRLLEHVPGDTRLRMAARYESYLDPMWELCIAGGKANYATLAACMTTVCYMTSREHFRSSKKYLPASPRADEPNPYAPDHEHAAFRDTLHTEYAARKAGDEPTIYDTAALVKLYDDALNSIKEGRVPVPEKGKGLFQANKVDYYRPKNLHWGMVENVLRAF